MDNSDLPNGIEFYLALDNYVQISLGYIYAQEELWTKYILACDKIGWNKATLLTQILHSYCSISRDWIIAGAELDAVARGFESQSGAYFDTAVAGGDFPPYPRTRPAFEESPLKNIPVQQGSENRRSFSYIRTSEANAAMLRIICNIEEQNISQVASRIALWHFNRYWSRSYQWQLNVAKARSLKPTEDGDVLPV